MGGQHKQSLPPDGKTAADVAAQFGRTIGHNDMWPGLPFRPWLIQQYLVKGWSVPTGLHPTALQAMEDHGRWIVLCPDEGCRGALMVEPSDKVFACVDCRADTAWWSVEFPE